MIEADRIGHDVLEPGGAAFDAVAGRWPAVVVDGRIDRTRLAAIVFNDGEELAALEEISHPHIATEIARRVAAAGDRDVVLELPLQSELGGPGWVRLVVDVAAEVRLGRAVARGMDADDVSRRLRSQPDRSQWVEGADIVVDNTGSIDKLETEVDRIWTILHQR